MTDPASNPYETEKLLEEYLLLHYGAPDLVLPWAFGPREALEFPARCVTCLLYTSQEAEHSGLPLKVTPADPDNLRIEPGLALSPGEYALVYEPREQAPTVFCFGIDAVTP